MGRKASLEAKIVFVLSPATTSGEQNFTISIYDWKYEVCLSLPMPLNPWQVHIDFCVNSKRLKFVCLLKALWARASKLKGGENFGFGGFPSHSLRFFLLLPKVAIDPKGSFCLLWVGKRIWLKVMEQTWFWIAIEVDLKTFLVLMHERKTNLEAFVTFSSIDPA